MKEIESKIRSSWMFWLVLFIPVAVVIWFVATFGVNVPVHDEWRLASLLDKAFDHTLNFNDLWALHGNHRILSLRLIFLGLAFTSGWNIYWELYFSIGVSIATLIIFYRLSLLSQKNHYHTWFYLSNLLTSIFLFSLVQRENWLWGFQIAWFLINLCLAIALLTFSTERLNFQIQVTIAAISCTIATFSVAHGLLAWIALIPLVFSLKGSDQQKIKKVIIWLIIFAIVTGIYFIDYHPTRRLNLLLLLQHPLLVGNYLLTLLGVPLIRYPVISALMGLIIFSLFGSLSYPYLVRLFNRQLDDRERHIIPWICLGIFAILSELFITLGRFRVEDGIQTALDTSRYSTPSVLLIIALVQLWSGFHNSTFAKENLLFNQFKKLPIYVTFATILISFSLVNSATLIRQSNIDLPYTKSRENCLDLIHYLEDTPFIKKAQNSCLFNLGNKTWIVRDGAKIMEKLQFRQLAKNVTWVKQPEKVYGYLDGPKTGNKPLIVKPNDHIKLTGWAVFPQELNQPDLVLLSNNDRPSFFATSYVVLDSPDVAKSLASERYNQARWSLDIGTENLSMGLNSITSWVYNPVAKEFIKLQDQVKIIVQN